MNNNEYGEIINGERTYQTIASRLLNGDTVGIGWTDEDFTHFDIIFKLGLDCKCGDFQRGIRQFYLFVGIIDHTFYGFSTDSTKKGCYIQEKLRMNNSCGDKVAELINGIIECLNESGETFYDENS